jgi:hypothetical protein
MKLRTQIIIAFIFVAAVTLGVGARRVYAAPTLEEVAESPETFLVCKTADILSTAYIIEHGIGYEANPLVAWSFHIGGYGPLILVSGLIYWWMKEHEDEKFAIVVANGVTCGVAVSNLLLIP